MLSLRCAVAVVCLTNALAAAEDLRRIAVADYVDKMKAGWVGQMVGVGWGFPTEFQYLGKVIPANEVPVWRPETVNQFNQDDLYVEMTFLRTLEQYGLDCPIRQAGIDFANSRYQLWHANEAGRNNLRRGISPPGSGHPRYNEHADDIDYQIEADYSGLIAPGAPQVPIDLGELFGRLMNYGDGVYGGQFVGALYSEAFFESDVRRIIDAGLRCLPPESAYAVMVRDVVAWSDEHPGDWQAVWRLVEEKYHNNAEHSPPLCSGHGGEDHFSIDAKLNGAYILLGLLYGDHDPDQTTVIAMRCGQDSDCNPSNAAGVLFTTIGYAQLPPRYTSALETDRRFSHTEYDFTALTNVSLKLARQAVERVGGRVERNTAGDEEFVIPVVSPRPSPLMASRVPEPIGPSRFSETEIKQIDPEVTP
ncbi:ADP-ribosylglycohydrolase [Botrimarina colliarenosi]|uniref:ADP-ribosylglycohydrolase n=1 Tax=Botrimarina colliarenosi TaxID=2528001 RepID=A0A5C5ZYH1_9BACT|nr:ADP-ribosylglycohydrolase family protein [Botrimarina colliarenosi]TWT92011.1 ADP-ribosylglycohydrolase [Botrimarina colliarenosi]